MAFAMSRQAGGVLHGKGTLELARTKALDNCESKTARSSTRMEINAGAASEKKIGDECRQCSGGLHSKDTRGRHRVPPQAG